MSTKTDRVQETLFAITSVDVTTAQTILALNVLYDGAQHDKLVEQHNDADRMVDLILDGKKPAEVRIAQAGADMLAALRAAEAYITLQPIGDGYSNVVKEVRAAIAKAEGRA